VGPRAGQWLADKLSLSQVFLVIWPCLHWSLAAVFAMLTVETIYYLGPQIKQRFVETLPGAAVCVICWIGLSRLLGIYFHYFANYNRTYGTLGGMMALMTWLYWSYFLLLAGCELNAELAKERNGESIRAGGGARHRRSTDRAA
jgi:membrane protein